MVQKIELFYSRFTHQYQQYETHLVTKILSFTRRQLPLLEQPQRELRLQLLPGMPHVGAHRLHIPAHFSNIPDGFNRFNIKIKYKTIILLLFLLNLLCFLCFGLFRNQTPHIAESLSGGSPSYEYI